MQPHISYHDYWNQRYAEHDTGWDIGHAAAPLVAYFEQLTDKDISILIPGCGNGYEAGWLLQHGFIHISMLDIAEAPVQKMREQFAHAPALKILHEDFFTHPGTYDLIVEQTFFCAIDPAQREAYAQKMQALLQSGGKLAGVLFNRQFDESPPFGGSTEEYRTLFEKYFTLHTLAPCYNSIPPRAGTEVFIIAKKNDDQSGW